MLQDLTNDQSTLVQLMNLGYGGAVVLARSPTGNYSTAMTFERQV